MFHPHDKHFLCTFAVNYYANLMKLAHGSTGKPKAPANREARMNLRPQLLSSLCSNPSAMLERGI